MGLPARGTGTDQRMRQSAVALSVAWTLGVIVAAAALRGSGPGGVIVTVAVAAIAVAMPLVMLWAGVAMHAQRRADRAAVLALDAAVADLARRLDVPARRDGAGDMAAMRDRIAALEAQAAGPVAPPPATKAERIAPPPSVPPPPPPSRPEPVQAELPMLDPPGDVDLSRAQVVRALNFPQTADDRAGFDLLRRALARHDLAQLLQASEDCLNYLAQNGLYMDDLLPAPARAEDWRAFAKGGRARAALLPIEGIRDEAALAVVQREMRADPVFRDAALVFQRRFDGFLAEFAPVAGDAEVLDLMDTRTGRAFVLFAQVNGSLGG